MSAAPDQSLIVVVAPVRRDAPEDKLRNLVAAGGNPALGPEATTLEGTDIVHFASLVIVETDPARPVDPRLYVVLELNVDGRPESALRTVAAATAAWLEPIFAYSDRRDGETLDKFLLRRMLKLQTWPWGAIGLPFNGVAEFSVSDIRTQAELAQFVSDALRLFDRNRVGAYPSAAATLAFVRELIVPRDPAVLHGFPANETAALKKRGAAFADFLERGDGQQYKFAAWKAPTLLEAVGTWAKARSTLPLWGFLLALTVLFDLVICLTNPSLRNWTSFVRPVFLIGSAMSAAFLLLAGVAALFLTLLRQGETQNRPDGRYPDLSRMRLVNDSENSPGYAQNHFLAVTTLPGGWFTPLRLAIALWGIGQVLEFFFRPGFVVTMGTIHYAKWFRLPGTNKFLFQANYDGSWESYLEDFIMKAHPGQTAAWSNSEGFPKTRYLTQDGASDGDRFKRWVRRQQVLAPFWYSRFPYLTAGQIRDNALTHDGLMRARTETAARAWLDGIGSMQRPANSIETAQVQSLVLHGLRDLSHMICNAVTLPADKAARSAWLNHITEIVTFGEFPGGVPETATFVAFSAAGLAECGLPQASSGEGLATFSSAFNIGMSGRARVLGDFGSSDPQRWVWTDAGADAVILVFGGPVPSNSGRLRTMMDGHIAALGGPAAVIEEIVTGPIQPGGPILNGAGVPGASVEHFGFRDGISQPVIQGTGRASKGAPQRDLVAPGEFIFGYPDNQGYFPLSPSVTPEADPGNCLPSHSEQNPDEFPNFASRSYLRDFGRNGTFLVLRKLQQDVAGFKAFTASKAAELNTIPGFAAMVGETIDADWVAAKMMGRRKDGRPLVSAGDNDFDFGVLDPQGLRCPLGAHIRRANPRTSLQPGDSVQQQITSRHRLLRRGRSYSLVKDNAVAVPADTGLLFIALCADLERQFEFIQQTWIKSPSFHGLKDEPDTIAAPDHVARQHRVFTIPTAAGPVQLQNMQSFVTVRAGGYFFLPSRAALGYLASL